MMSTAMTMLRSTGRQRRRGLRRWVLAVALILMLPSLLAWRDAPSPDQAPLLINADLSLASTMPTRAYVCTIGGAIDAGLARYVARVVREASAAGAAVVHLLVHRQGFGDDVMRAFAFQVGDEADAACVVFVGRVVEPLPGRRPRGKLLKAMRRIHDASSRIRRERTRRAGRRPRSHVAISSALAWCRADWTMILTISPSATFRTISP